MYIKSIINQSIYSTCIGTLALAVASCSYLDIVPDNTVTEESKWVDRQTAERTLATVYKTLPPLGDYNGNPGFLGSGEIVLPNLTQWINQSAMKLFLRTNSPAVNAFDYWQGEWGGYSGLRQCNDFLAGVDKVVNLETSYKERMKAEVKIIKAYEMFYMLRQYGPICPLRVNPPVEQSTQGNRTPRENVDDTFAYIIQLLDEAIDSNSLPTVITDRATELGRFTVAAAKFLKAKVLLYWASPLFNGNTDYSSFLNDKGEPFFNQEYDETRWRTAAEACDDAVEACLESGIRLYTESEYKTRAFLSEETLKSMALRSAITEKWNCEIVWACTTNMIGGGIAGQSFPILNAGENGWKCEHSFGVPLETVNKFYTKNGLPIEHDNFYNSEGLYQIFRYDASDSKFNEKYDYDYNRHYIIMETYHAGMNFDREPRFYSSMGFNRGVWYGNYSEDPIDDVTEVNSNTYVSPRCYYGEYSSVYNSVNYSATGYWPKKLVSVDLAQRARTDNISWTDYPYPDMRYADLLLMAAEAWNEVSGPSDKVFGYIDQIRTRAGLEGLRQTYEKYAKPAYKSYCNTKDNLRTLIHRERSIELAFEGKLYWDELRWKTAEKNLNRSITGWNMLGNSEKEAELSMAQEYYVPTFIYTQGFSHRDYFFPIPDREMQRNPALRQSPGW